MRRPISKRISRPLLVSVTGTEGGAPTFRWRGIASSIAWVGGGPVVKAFPEVSAEAVADVAGLPRVKVNFISPTLDTVSETPDLNLRVVIPVASGAEAIADVGTDVDVEAGVPGAPIYVSVPALAVAGLGTDLRVRVPVGVSLETIAETGGVPRVTVPVASYAEAVSRFGADVRTRIALSVTASAETYVGTDVQVTGGEPATWTPEDYEGALGHWYDASDADTLTLSGSAVVSWADKSGNGHHLGQGTSERRGTLTASNANFNNLPTVAFPSGGGMASSTKAPGLSATYLVDGFSSSLGLSISSIGATAGWSLPANIISSVRVPAATLTTGNVLHRLNGETISNTWDDGGATLTDPMTAFFVGRVLSYGQGTDYGRIFDAGGNFTLANRSSDWARTANKQFAELIIVRGFLDTSDIEIFEGYLAHKWGLEGSLPSDHPYKDNAPTPPA